MAGEHPEPLSTATFPSRQGCEGVTPRIRPLLALIAATSALVMVVADTSPAGTIATQSLGVHERTGFASLIARADGGITALQGDRIETYLQKNDAGVGR